MTLEIHVAQGHCPDTRWSIILRIPTESTCTIYTTQLETTTQVPRYEHDVREDAPFPPVNLSPLLVATIPEDKFLKFETGCVFGTWPGPSQHYVVRVLYQMLEREYVQMAPSCVRDFRSLAEYEDGEERVRDGYYVEKDRGFYERVDQGSN